MEKTQEEIAAYIKKIQPQDFFGFRAEVLIGYLDFEHAKEFLKEGTTADQWTAAPQSEAKKELSDYVEFGWGKVQDHRGLSASRTISKVGSWVWLLDGDAAFKEFEAVPYPQYGAPQLKWVCERYGFPIPDDEGRRRMMNGEECDPDGCQEGCGS